MNSEIKPLSKFAFEDKMQEDLGAQDRSVLNVHENPSTKSTQRVISKVEFEKRPIQYLLEEKHTASFKEEDYIVTKANKTAFALIKSWPNWGNFPLSHVIYLYGDQGSGKSHLASIWQKVSNAKYVSKTLLQSKDFQDTNYILENFESVQGYEQNILHLFNHVITLKKYMLITARRSVVQLQIKLPDLYSRMQGIISAKIEDPDDNLIEAIISKYFSDFQIRVAPRTIKYLVKHIDRSYSAMANTLLSLDKASLVKKSRISIDLIKDILHNQ